MIFSYDTFNRINESVERVEKNGLVEEGLLAAIKFPIKFTKIKNNAKKYLKAKMKHMSVEVALAKKKANTNWADLPPEKKEVVKLAADAKKRAIDLEMKSITDRIAKLASSPMLQDYAAYKKGEADLEAALELQKNMESEADQILIQKRIKNLQTKQAERKAELETKPDPEEDKGGKGDQKADETPSRAEQDAKAEKEKEKAAEDKKKQAVEDAKKAVADAKAAYDEAKDGDDEKATLKAEIAFKQAQQKKAKLEDNDELYQGLGDDIGDIMQKIQDLDKDKDPKVKRHEDKIKEYEEAIDVLKDKTDKKSKGDLQIIQSALKSEKEKLAKAKEESK